MPTHLIFLFLFQSGLAFAFTWFIAGLILSGAKPDDSHSVRRTIRLIRVLVLTGLLIIPPVLFLAYYKSLPEGEPSSLAIWPAVWMLMILSAIILGLTGVLWKHGRTSPPT